MAKKKKSLEERVAEQVKKLLPEGMVPDSYLEYVVMENADIDESEAELMGDVKMQMFEETGVDMPMTRDEAESYLCDEISDEQWPDLSHEDRILTSQVRVLEESFDRTILEMLREMPLIPAARVLGSIVTNYLRAHGQEISEERAEEITEDMIHTLDCSVSDMVLDQLDHIGFDPDGDEGPEIEFDFDDEDELPFGDASDEDGRKAKDRVMRRSRITRFPGKS